MTSRKKQSDSGSERLEQLAQALHEAQLMLLEQSRKLDELRTGSGERGDGLDDVRTQLDIVTAERDQLQKQLLALEGLQTETIALTKDIAGHETSDTQPGLPSIDDLLSGLNAILEDSEARRSGRQLNGPSAEAPDAVAEEMIAPEIIAPEVFEGAAREGSAVDGRSSGSVLVFMDGEKAVTIPVRAGTMTLGRSESASIRIDNPYISRIHARLVSRNGETEIVDAGSTNGFKINSVAVKRHRLKHGDVIMIGQRKIKFVDTDESI